MVCTLSFSAQSSITIFDYKTYLYILELSSILKETYFCYLILKSKKKRDFVFNFVQYSFGPSLVMVREIYFYDDIKNGGNHPEKETSHNKELFKN